MNKENQFAPVYHLELALKEYGAGQMYETLKDARSVYFNLTGEVYEEDDDYESRMNAFNEWFLSEFKVNDLKSPIQIYLEKFSEVEFEVKESLENINYSLFEYKGANLFGEDVLEDVLHARKIKLPKDSLETGLLKGDLFIGRTVQYIKETRLLDGMCFLPREAYKIVKKQARKVRKLEDENAEKDFLILTEALKTKCKRYNHVDIKRIFVYPDTI